MPFSLPRACLLAGALAACVAPAAAKPRPQHPPEAGARITTLAQALRAALAGNPRIPAAERDVGIASGQLEQAGVLPNPVLSGELDNALGTREYAGLRSAESTLQISQLIELGGKREARVAVGLAATDTARYQAAAARLEVLSETASAFVGLLGAQRRGQILDVQIAALDQLTPQLQKRVDAGAAPQAEIARSRLAANLARADRERASTALAVARRELQAVFGDTAAPVGSVTGDLGRIMPLPPFAAVARAVQANPQLVRYTAVYAQRQAELLAAQLQRIPDVTVGAAWRHFNATGDDGVRLTLSVPLPVFDQNTGNIRAARENLGKVTAEETLSRTNLMLTLGRAYETAVGAAREVDALRKGALVDARDVTRGITEGYDQGRFSLVEVLDAQSAATQAALREADALVTYHTAVATIEGLTGVPFSLAKGGK